VAVHDVNIKYVIDPRDFRTDHFYTGCLVVFWLIWAPATAIVTWLAFTDHSPFFFIWLIFGYLGTVGIPLALLNKNRKQTLEVSGESLIITGAGTLPTSKMRIHKQNLRALTLEHYDDSDQESVCTLNLLQKPGHRPARIMLASFVHPKDKVVLIEEISTFLHSHGFVFEVKNEM
jgi:hypothetical protein